MNVKEILIFLIVLFSIYFLGNFYIYKRSVQALALDGRYLNYYRTLFLTIVLCYPIAKLGTGFFGGFFLSKYLNIIGSIFMGVMLYCLLIIFFVDILRAINHFIHFFPDIITKNKILAGRVTFALLFFIILCIATYGVSNAKYLRVIEQEVLLDKLKPEHDGFTIVQISDIHFGDLINEKFLIKVTEKVNSLEPDIVVITGDLIDDGSVDLRRLWPLLNLKSKIGNYFVSGNHDNFPRFRPSDSRQENNSNVNVNSMEEDSIATNNSFIVVQDNFLKSALALKLDELGFKVLNNEYVDIDSIFTLFGVSYRFGISGNTGIGAIVKLLDGYNKELPLIMLKHVPTDLDNIDKAGVDLLLAGHTHHGQMIPLTFITDKVYEISHGYGKHNNLQVYVNCGTGFWGPPLKIGVPAEITKIILRNN